MELSDLSKSDLGELHEINKGSISLDEWQDVVQNAREWIENN